MKKTTGEALAEAKALLQPSQEDRHGEWLDEALQRHKRLTDVISALVRSLLENKGVDYLTISGRTKDKTGALEKIKRKGYENPREQMTDLTGVRVIVFLESDVDRVSNIISESFEVDRANSLNKDAVLQVNQTGYRSVHFVCDIGTERGRLPEFEGLSGLKFEFQVRTLLQHAWAELAHDRNYKFSGKLPREMERQLYLYAGMLEIADKGLDQLSAQIDAYSESLREKGERHDFKSPIDSISLAQFCENWANENNMEISRASRKRVPLSDLIDELREFGVTDLESLRVIIPSGYAEAARKISYSPTIYGLVRDWMLISDWRKFINDVNFKWVMDAEEAGIFNEFMSRDELDEFLIAFSASRR
ncbi:TPA: hypothetical protein QDB40_002781 [Burkholderia vietnamiensis]|uniref:GTP pyrophosphokinase n=2 Tax=Bacteria TaxID=2 RepID=UPI001BA55C95|nr:MULTISPECIES: hypothetical protein [Burkholderia]MDO5917346.1 hypothetical protein [Burkholderia cenocepacia]MDP9543273.1 ppGpp synthetase/RelA/SpoT-type nucleotidyltransferase [Burkholderia cepacia]HDR9168798.1 hypothetical protein [Burkholderia vietnamiensis]